MTISILSFLTLAWASFAVSRHIRRGSGGPAPVPAAARVEGDMLGPDRTRPGRFRSAQRFDRTYAHDDSGNLNDPGARARTRPQRDHAG